MLVISGPNTNEPGTVYTLSLSASDVGNDPIGHWTVTWGDGTVDTLTGNPSAALHTYPLLSRTYAVSASATDPDDTFAAGNTVTVAAHFADPNAGFFAEVFHDLHCNVDPGALAFFTNFLDQGPSRFAFVQRVQNDLTFKEYFRVEVNDAYLTLLHRPAEPQALTGGANFLASGGTLDQLKAIILGSPEYFIFRGGNTNDGFLDALFQDTLGRGIDPMTRANINQYLAEGGSRQLLAQVVLQAREADAFAVKAFYLTYLGRQADPNGLTYATDFLQASQRDETLTALFLATDEFFAHANNQ